MKPEVVRSTAFDDRFPASNVLTLTEEDAFDSANNKANYWLAEGQQTTGQGFTIKLDGCTRQIIGCQIKNKGKGQNYFRITKEFRVSGSLNENGPYQTLLEEELIDTRGKAFSLLNFTFEEPVQIKYLRFDLVSYWGPSGGGLQYFAAIPATGKYQEHEIEWR